MTEIEWVNHVARQLRRNPWFKKERLRLHTSLKLAYGSEILSYGTERGLHVVSFETDLALTELLSNGQWKPRVVVEAKLGSITTHDAITYSQKAAAHRAVHPYLRYGGC
jgi:hypothetical protein